ncbi:MAG: hypothetical protein KJP07_07185 [Desulfatitalea sp.]|nr:hypothetical protein [Desulfatitalea sp.]
MKNRNVFVIAGIIFLLMVSEVIAAISDEPGALLSFLFPSEQGYVDTGYADWKVLAKAQPDECYYGLGSSDNEYPMTSPCSGTLKTNSGYVWGMTKFGDKVFFGTGANVMCLAVESYLQVANAMVNPDFVCEMGESNSAFGDFRPPQMFVYAKSAGLQKLVVPAAAQALLSATIGIRSAGVHPSGIVFLAGPIARDGGIAMFAFAGQTGQCIGATRLTISSNIRNIITTSSGEIYMGVGGTEAGDATGAVFKWQGNPAAIYGGDTQSLFAFEKVGEGLDGEAAYLCEHDGRIFVTTWPDNNDPENYAGLWASPPLPLSADSVHAWEKLWSTQEYDPYLLAAKLYGGGALASFGGYLYWGTMHVPGTTYYYHTNGMADEPTNDIGRLLLADNLNRSLSLFRGRNFGTASQKIELLYGGDAEGNFRVPSGWGSKFKDKKNLMGLTPLYGPGGINNEWNNYCWSMNVFNNHLYMGTMDYSPMTQQALNRIPPESTFGFDLFRFDSTSDPAVRITANGLGNENQYGIRTMISDNDTLYIGTAGNANLQPGGGWELIGLKETSFSDSYVYSGPYRVEAENMALEHMGVEEDASASEDQVAYNTRAMCSATFTHTENSGTYDIAIRYYTPGGSNLPLWGNLLGWRNLQSTMRFYVDNQLIAENQLSGDTGWHVWHIDKVQINDASTIDIDATLLKTNKNESFKIDFMHYRSAD